MSTDTDLHIVPNNDLREHETARDCWCRPTLDDESSVWVHNAMDGREKIETGEAFIH